MKKNSIFLTISCLLFCFSAPCISFANSSGFEKSTALFNSLQKAGSSPAIQNLVFNENNNFPYNIIDTFSSNSEKKITGENYNNQLSELHFVFKIEDFYDREEIVSKIVKAVDEAEKKIRVTLDFTWGDDFSSDEIYLVKGSEILSSSISDPNRTAIVCINLSKRNYIITGGKKHTSPTFLIKAVTNSFYKNDMEYRICGGLINFLYRYDFLKSDRKGDVFFEKGLSTIALEFSEEEAATKLPDFVKCAVENIKTENTVNPDFHSIIFPVGNKTIVSSERLTVLLYIFVSLISIFILCELSFIHKNNRDIISNEILRMWYIIPFVFGITVLLLFFSELLVLILYNFFQVNNYIQIALKLSFTFIISSFGFFFILKKHKNLISNAYSWFMTICSVVNLLFFPIIDISLFYLFAIEYILVYITRPEKRTVSLSASFLILLLPFAPYVIQILKYTESSCLSKIVHGGFLMNITIAQLLIPFEILWLRILVRLNQKWKTATENTKHFYMQNITSIVTAFVICIFIIIITDLMIPKKYKTKEITDTIKITEGKENILGVKIRDDIYFDEVTRIITIDSSENFESACIKVASAEGNPILYSDNDYVSVNSNLEDYFRIPVNPPKHMNFRYIANPLVNSTITVTAVQKKQDADGKITEYRTHSKILTMKAKSNGTK